MGVCSVVLVINVKTSMFCCFFHGPLGPRWSILRTHLQGPYLLLCELCTGRTLCPKSLQSLSGHIDHRLQYLQVFPQLLLIGRLIGHHTHTYTHTLLSQSHKNRLFDLSLFFNANFCLIKRNRLFVVLGEEFLFVSSCPLRPCFLLKQTTVDCGPLWCAREPAPI